MILLFNPRSSASGKHVLPMSVLAVAAVLEGRYDYELVDGNVVDDPLVPLRRIIKEEDVDILAITVMPGRQVAQARDVSRALKSDNPELVIIWGGYFPTMYEDAVMTAPFVDFVLRGHGEEPFVALVDAIREGNGRRNQAGLTYREADRGKIISNPLGPVPNLDALPDYPWKTTCSTRFWAGGHIPITPATGARSPAVFAASSTWSMANTLPRARRESNQSSSIS